MDVENKEHLTTKIFSVIRFPLCIAVLFVHASMDDQYNCVDSVSGDWQYPMLHYLNSLLYNVIGRVGSPLFFFISGYLFFYKIPLLSKSVYLGKLKRRVKTLLIPYIFWNLLAAAGYIILCSIPQTYNCVPDPQSFTLNWGIFKRALYGASYHNMIYPLAYQFWFIRDLMVCVLISPVIYYFIKATRWWGISLLALVWICNFQIPYLGMRGFGTRAIFFFSAGGWFSVRSLDIVNYVKDFKAILFIYPILIVADYLSLDSRINLYIHSFAVLTGIIFWFVAAAILLKRKCIKPVPFLSSASFLIYALHEPWLMSSQRVFGAKYQTHATDFELCCIYLLKVLIAVGLSLGVYYILKKLTPKFLALITGSRVS